MKILIFQHGTTSAEPFSLLKFALLPEEEEEEDIPPTSSQVKTDPNRPKHIGISTRYWITSKCEWDYGWPHAWHNKNLTFVNCSLETLISDLYVAVLKMTHSNWGAFHQWHPDTEMNVRVQMSVKKSHIRCDRWKDGMQQTIKFSAPLYFRTLWRYKNCIIIIIGRAACTIEQKTASKYTNVVSQQLEWRKQAMKWYRNKDYAEHNRQHSNVHIVYTNVK